eukprot:CAMPEP_0181328516 /NCGR_PEP_ID=MMETSP1101-20121128/22769_1 /TAXON_ID=46948 /ORGANISM="Rhodomonas abbreviata, Strain Caron Lab Isolate" /LENGTH=91 /DNA_ID=CAMNT_0023437433 /DNA_START=74 /DNA_END=349 /DNA_ORIENTATION=-
MKILLCGTPAAMYACTSVGLAPKPPYKTRFCARGALPPRNTSQISCNAPTLNSSAPPCRRRFLTNVDNVRSAVVMRGPGGMRSPPADSPMR